MNQPEMAAWSPEESAAMAAAQEQDLAEEKRAIVEATDRIYRAIQELELLYNMGLPDLRRDIRFLELVIWRK